MEISDKLCFFFEDEAFLETDRPGFRRRVMTGDNLQLCFWRIAGGATGSFLHHHPENEQLGIVVRGKLDFRIGEPEVRGPHRARRRRGLPREAGRLARRLRLHR